MKKILYYIPAIIFTVFYGAVAIYDIGIISPVVAVWLVMFLMAGILLNKDMFWGGFLGALPAIHLIYMGTQETGQIINEMPIGIIVLLFYFVCGSFIFYKSNIYMFQRNKETKKEATAIGIIGKPDEETIIMLEKQLGKPIKKIEKNGKIILLVGKGLLKKKIVIPIEE